MSPEQGTTRRRERSDACVLVVHPPRQLVRIGAWLTLVVVLTTVPACGHDARRDVVRDAAGSLGRVRSGTVHLEVEVAARPHDAANRIGFQVDGRFDLAPPGGVIPAVDLTTTNLGAAGEPPTHLVSTGHDAFVVQDGVGHPLGARHDAPGRLDASGSADDIAGRDLRDWVIDPAAQPPGTSSTAESVDRVTGRADPVSALNGAIDFARRLGVEPDPALRISPADAGHVRTAVQTSTFEVLVGRNDHALRSLDVEAQLATSAASTGGAVVHALNKLGQVTLTITLRIDRPNEPVTITPPAQVAG